jgi:alkanesulfonate monooxygenase SsuD/methylene tetrahydromethanopterin reductase-like flavin-dependent oxidoreductase (luciferase family)
MPYPELPASFSEDHRSVWVDPPSHLFDPKVMYRAYNEYLDEMEHADRLGFDGVTVNEHHQNAYGLMPSPNLMAAALTRRTQNCALTIIGDSIALFNPPLRVAEELAMLDVMSGGRVIAGFPVGTSMDTNYCYGMTPATLRERYYEAHDLIMQSWKRPEIFSFNGKYTQLRYVNLWPRPLQQPHPPVWVPGGGSLETWEWSTKMDYFYAFLSFFGYQYGKGVLKGFWDTVERMGGHDNPYRAGYTQLLAISENDELAEKEYSPHVDYFFDKCLHVAPVWAEAPGYRTMRSVKAGLANTFGNSSGPNLLGMKKMSFKERVDQGFVIAGSPQTVLDRLAGAIKDLRVGHVLTMLHFGDMGPELTKKNSELFAREVMPHLRDMWKGYEDNWTPKPLPKEEKVAISAK